MSDVRNLENFLRSNRIHFSSDCCIFDIKLDQFTCVANGKLENQMTYQTNQMRSNGRRVVKWLLRSTIVILRAKWKIGKLWIEEYFFLSKNASPRSGQHSRLQIDDCIQFFLLLDEKKNFKMKVTQSPSQHERRAKLCIIRYRRIKCVCCLLFGQDNSFARKVIE